MLHLVACAFGLNVKEHVPISMFTMKKKMRNVKSIEYSFIR